MLQLPFCLVNYVSKHKYVEVFKSFVFAKNLNLFLLAPSTLYLELSLHSEDGSDIVVNEVGNELRLSFPRADWEFGSQNLYLQQYNPNATSSYTLYNVKNLISEGNGVGTIVLDNLTGTYQSQNPYAYFRLSFG